MGHSRGSCRGRGRNRGCGRFLANLFFVVWVLVLRVGHGKRGLTMAALKERREEEEERSFFLSEDVGRRRK